MKTSQVAKLRPFNLVGQRFGNLLVIGLGNIKNGGRSWICNCSCGNTVRLGECKLLKEGYKSCGCNSHPTVSAIERFERYFNRTNSNDCWEWTGSKLIGGYGQFPSDISRRAHVFSYVSYVGEIPEGMQVLHKCDNPPCVNPNHLFLGTQKDNMVDMVNKGRKAVISMPGELNPNHKLTERDVKSIKKLWNTGEYNISSLSKRFGVGWTTVSDIVKLRK